MFSRVDLRNPVVRTHFLNRGRAAWWLGLPGWTGGARLWDLLGLTPGALPVFATGGGWNVITRPGALAHSCLNFLGGVSIALPRVFPINGGCTLACWVSLSNSGESGAFIKLGDTSGGIGLGVGGTQLDNGGNNLIGLYEQVTWINTAIAIGYGWHHVVMTVDTAGAAAFYLDGKDIYGHTGSTPIAPANTTYLGGYSVNGVSRFYSGPADDFSLWTRPLSAAEVHALYEESLSGYRHTLTRRDLARYFRTSLTSPGNRLIRSPLITPPTLSLAWLE